MPAKDLIHTAVKNALIKEGWIITDDPLLVEYGGLRAFIDVAAERLIAAERVGEKIAVEIKSFVGRSLVHDIELAFGQYIVYRGLLAKVEPDRSLYLAISSKVYNTNLQRQGVQMLFELNEVSLIVVDLAKREIVKWETK
jgi:hypothetical protein